jgi:hypothetical protein
MTVVDSQLPREQSCRASRPLCRAHKIARTSHTVTVPHSEMAAATDACRFPRTATVAEGLSRPLTRLSFQDKGPGCGAAELNRSALTAG